MREREDEKKELIAGRILERMPLGCLISDASFRFLDWNPEAERIFGFSRTEALGRHYFELIVPPRQQGVINALFERFVHGEMDVREVGLNATKSGELIQCEWHNTPLFDENGVFEGLVALVRDISVQHLAEEALRDNEAFLRQAQEVAQVGSWVSGIGKNDRLRWSKEVFRIFKVPEADFDGRVKFFFDHVHPDDRTAVLEATRAAVEDGALYDFDHRIIRPDGAVRWVRERATVYHGPDGKPDRLLGIVQDITERKAAEERLREALKLEAIGRLAGTVANDFANLMTVVSGNAEILRQGIEAGEPRELIEDIILAAQRAAALGKELLSFGRGQLLRFSVFDLNTVLLEMKPRLRRLTRNAQLELALAESLGAVRADDCLMEQVIVELVSNAWAAMPSGGSILIETRNVEVDREMAKNHLGMEPGPHVLLAVSDTGPGMDEETRLRIFEPFFSIRKGSPTPGLAPAYGVVRQSGGTIWVYSELGHGTVFKIYLPRVDAKISRVPRSTITHGGETILLVEDDPTARRMAALILESCGYFVLEAGDGLEAEAVAAAFDGTIELLLSDLIMPKRNGVELAEKMRAVRKDIRVLFMSGFTERFTQLGGRVYGELIEKPFTRAALLEKVRASLHQGAGATASSGT